MQYMVVFITVVLVLVGLGVAISANHVDRGECLASERYLATQIIMIGKTPIPQAVTRTRCTRWEFPEGKPE